MIIIDLKQFIFKNKLITYIEAFDKFYNKKNHKQIYIINKIIKFEKI